MGTISLSDALVASAAPKMLRVDAVMERELDAADAAVMLAAIRDAGMPAKRIQRALQQLGVTCGDTAIAHWRDIHGVGKASHVG